MPAYVIGRLQVHDAAWGAEYGERIRPLLEKHGGRYLVRAVQLETLEGGAPLPSAMVVLEFPSLEHARAWYHDPDYAPLIRLRQSGSEAEIVLADGL